MSSPKTGPARLRSADFTSSVAPHFTLAGRERSLPILVGDQGRRVRERPHSCGMAVCAARGIGSAFRWRAEDVKEPGVRPHPEGPDMNLNTIEEVRGATVVDGGTGDWREGDSWLAGGTW